MQTHKPVGFEITAVVREYTEMPSAYKDVHTQYSSVGLQRSERQSIVFVGCERKLESNQESRM